MNVEGDTVELLQRMIRNRCVNTNAVESGQEQRMVEVLESFFDGSDVDTQVFESAPGRQSLVVRLPGTDPNAPSLMLMGHTDVVPANEANWEHDPFGGELIDGFVWGRGAIDMLNLTATMAIATRQLAREGFRPTGDLIFLAVADEESGGSLGAQWLMKNHPDAVRVDNVVTEWGGVPLDSPTGSKLWITVGQKGGTDCVITVRGTSAHASMPFETDNALVKAARIIQRIGEYKIAPEITPVWRQQIEAMGYAPDLTAALLDPSRIDEALGSLSPGLAKRAHACTRTTATPTVMHGGVKANVIPDSVQLNVLIRRLPNHTYDDVINLLHDMLGDLADEVDISVRMNVDPTQSPVDTPLWHSLQKVSSTLVPEARCIPSLTPGGNDAGVFRDTGAVAYGFGLISNAISIERFFEMFHGDNERIDLESLRLSRELWYRLAHDFLGSAR